MKRLTQVHVIAAAVIVCLSAPEARAQSEKVSVRMAPRPDQTVQMTMTQDMDFDVAIVGGGAAQAGDTSMKMLMRLTTALTQKTGPLKADGSVDAELTYDQIAAEMSMNGQQMPASEVAGLVGKAVVVTYNANGDVVGVKGLPEASGLTDESFRQMLSSFSGSLPATALGVGETTSGPLNLALPVPLPFPGGLMMTGETILKLVSLDRDAQGRTARFDSTINGKMDSAIPSPDGKSQVKFDFTMIGDGTVIMDLDKGVPRSNVATSTFNGRMNVPAGAAPGAMSMTMRGTAKIVMSSK